MIVINLFGAPGSGKSTMATGLFSMLKQLGFYIEYVPEFAKELTYEQNKRALFHQEYVFGVQSYNLARLNNDIDIAITDSPLPLSIIFNKNLPKEEFKTIVMSEYSKYENINIFVVQGNEYQTYGRNETKTQAEELGCKIQNLFNELSQNTTTIGSICYNREVMTDVKLRSEINKMLGNTRNMKKEILCSCKTVPKIWNIECNCCFE